MKISLFYKPNKIEPEYIQSLKNKISSFGFELDDTNPDVVLFVGGDGTFLRAVHQYLDRLDKISFVGLNKGHLGFFSSYSDQEEDLLLNDLKNNKVISKSYRLLKASFANNEIFAINEIRIESPFQTLISEVEIDNKQFETFRGSGLVVCSALGSSAYNKSLSGAVVSPSLEVMELTEIAPINNRVFSSLKSPLVLDSNSEIVLKPKTSNVLIGYDHLTIKDDNSEVIKFTLSDKRVSLLCKEDYNYITHLAKAFIED